jgi:hypothetical protein
MLIFYILHSFLGDSILVKLHKKGKLQTMAPLKTFSPFGKEKGAIGKNEKDYIKLHIISPKLIRIPRSRDIVTVHILQYVRIGP